MVKGKQWLLLTGWVNLDAKRRQMFNEPFALNRRVMKAYLFKESLERLLLHMAASRTEFMVLQNAA